MRFLLKVIILLLLAHGGIAGLIIGQRVVIPTRLEHALEASDTCNGVNCWFYITLDGTTRRRDVQGHLDKLGATYHRMNAPRVSFWLRDGTGEVAFENGIAVATCFFPHNITLGDVIATFGDPDGFWTEYQGLYYGRNSSRLIYIKYEMLYQDHNIHLIGYIQLDPNSKHPRLSLQTAVDELCTPISVSTIVDAFSAQRWVEWTGFNSSLQSIR